MIFFVDSYNELTNLNGMPCPLLVKRTFLKVFKSILSIKREDFNLVQNIIYIASGFF
jgi:hypothetical protein